MSAASGTPAQERLALPAAHDENAIERTTPPAPRLWIRFGRDRRYHAIYVEEPRGYWSYCSRFFPMYRVREACPPNAMHGASRCACCVTRIKLPYLLPPELERVRGAEVGR